jgi:hypothetical protein
MCEGKEHYYKHHHQRWGHHGHHHGCHHKYHKGYSSIVKRIEDQVVVPTVLLEVADVNKGEFLEITVRKVKKHHHMKE